MVIVMTGVILNGCRSRPYPSRRDRSILDDGKVVEIDWRRIVAVHDSLDLHVVGGGGDCIRAVLDIV